MFCYFLFTGYVLNGAAEVSMRTRRPYVKCAKRAGAIEFILN
jgi:hypothetical protein